MTTRQSHRSGRGMNFAGDVPIALLLTGAGVLLFRFPARVMECDAVTYASAAKRGGVADLCNPGHIAYGFLERAALHIGQRMSPPANPIFLLQYLSLVAALAGAYFLYRALVEARVERLWGLIFAATFLFSYGLWHYATQAESYTLAAFFIAAFMWRFIRFLKSPSVRNGVVAGAILGTATLAHQTALLLLPAAVAGALAPTGRAERARATGALVTAAVATAGIPYLVLGWTLLGLRSPVDFQRWAFGLSKWGWWGGWSAASAAQALVGATRSFVGSHFLLGLEPVRVYAMKLFPGASWEDELAIASYVSPRFALALLVTEGFVIAVALVAVARRLSGIRHLLAMDRGLTLFLVVWLAVLGIFFTWWAPERAEFWIPWFPALIMLVAIRTGHRGSDVRGPIWGAAAFLAALFAVNFWGSIYPQSLDRMEPDTLAALAIEAVVEPGDVVLSDTNFSGRATRYVQSFEKVDLIEACARLRPPDIAAGYSLSSRTRAVVASIIAQADSEDRAVYLLATALSRDAKSVALYDSLVAIVAQEFDASEPLPVRADVDLRRVTPRAPAQAAP